MHFKPHEFAGLQEVLQQLPHVFQMGQRTGGAPVTLTAVQNVARSGKALVEAERFPAGTLHKLPAQFHHPLLAFSGDPEVGMNRNAMIVGFHHRGIRLPTY